MFYVKIIVLATGMAIWGLVLIFLFGFITFKISDWTGWKWFEKWWRRH